MSDNFTVEQLITEIHDATSLSDLKRMVGPTKGMTEEAVRRLQQIDQIWARCEKHYGSDTATWPWDDKEIYDRLMKEQGEFENEYC